MTVKERLKEILSITEGKLVFQEQVIAILKDVAGFSKEDAYKAFKCAAKNKIECVNEYIQELEKKLDDKECIDFITKLLTSNLYDGGFSPAHSISYSHLAFQNALIKEQYSKGEHFVNPENH